MHSVLLLGALVLSSAAQERVLVFDLKSDDEGLARTLTGIVASVSAEQPGLQTVSSDDLREMVGLEKQKEVLGCGDQAGCIAELGDAYGARYVVHGRVGQVGETLVINVTLFDALKAAAVGRVSIEAAASEAPSLLRRETRRMFSEVLGAGDVEGGALPIGLGVTGAALGTLGVLAIAYGELTLVDTRAPPVGPDGADKRAGQLVGWLGVGALVVGAAVAAWPVATLLGDS